MQRPTKFASSVLSVLVLFLAQTAIANAAQSISGTPCPKLGLTQKIGTNKFTCVNTKEKLFWDNGTSTIVKALPATPDRSFTDVQLAEPNLSCSQTGLTAFSLKGPLICKNKSWLLVAPAQDSVESKAYRSVLDHWNKQPQGALSVKYFIDPKAGEWKNKIQYGLNAGAKFWGTSDANSRAIPAVISENYLYIEKVLETAGIYFQEEDKARNRNAQGGQAGFHGRYDDPDAFWDFLFNKADSRNNVGFYQVAPHEYTHFAQSKLSNARFNSSGNLPWMHEGIASYIGSALGPMSKMPHNQISEWKSELSRAKTSLQYFELDTQALYLSKNWSDIYPLGAVASEGLVALFGVSTLISFYTDMGSGLTAEESIQKNFKLNGAALTNVLDGYIKSVQSKKSWSLATLEERYKRAVDLGK
jgi:hypothetical protein